MHDAGSPPLRLRAACTKGTATYDWTLPQAISITQAGGTASCCSAVAIATDTLWGWMRGCKSTAHLQNKHVARRSGQEKAFFFPLPSHLRRSRRKCDRIYKSCSRFYLFIYLLIYKSHLQALRCFHSPLPFTVKISAKLLHFINVHLCGRQVTI